MTYLGGANPDRPFYNELTPIKRGLENSVGWIGTISQLGAFLAGVLAVLMARTVEIEPPAVVSLTVWRAGAPIMKLNGKSRLTTLCLRRHTYERCFRKTPSLFFDRVNMNCTMVLESGNPEIERERE